MPDSKKNNRKRLLIVVNDAAFFMSHRLPVALAAVREGYEVHVATPHSKSVADIKALDLQHHVAAFNRSGMNPMREIWMIVSLYRLFRNVRADVVHLVTIKPVIYGGIVARLASTPAVVAAISGLGHVFSVEGWRNSLLRKFVVFLYRQSLSNCNLRVILQNPTDLDIMLNLGIVDIRQAVLIPGSGVDLTEFKPGEKSNSSPIVLMASRLIKNKGVGEFLNAARTLTELNIQARFVLVGSPDADNPQSLSLSELEVYCNEDIVECWGFRSDMPIALSSADIVVLPSYYGEGLPKILIEAAACGCAVITTDTPGCRDAISENVTGLLITPRSSDALAEAMKQLLLNPQRRANMGRAGRDLAEQVFSVESVVEAHLGIYKVLLKNAE